MSELTKLDQKYVAPTYARFPVEIVGGKGSRALASDGREYIDMGSGIGVNAFGYADPLWCEAIAEQLYRVQHTSNLYVTQPCVQLAKALCERTGAARVFFGNSGAEANECAIKVARKYAKDAFDLKNELPARTRSTQPGGQHTDGAQVDTKQAPATIITLKNSFHGRTLTTLAATGQDYFHELFQPLTPGFMSVPANDISALKQACLRDDTCAILLECIQGEGGVNVLTQDYVQAAADFANKNGMLLMIDEVQTGNGRTGELYSYMHYGIVPDVVTTAKGLGGGLPIGACLLFQKVEQVLQPGDHGSTFGGNPVCCAGALSVLERLTDEFLVLVREKGEYIAQRLEGAPGVIDVTGRGLMIGILTKKPAGDVVKACMDQGVLCLTAKNKVRLLPPLNISIEDLDSALDVICAACK